MTHTNRTRPRSTTVRATGSHAATPHATREPHARLISQAVIAGYIHDIAQRHPRRSLPQPRSDTDLHPRGWAAEGLAPTSPTRGSRPALRAAGSTLTPSLRRGGRVAEGTRLLSE